VLELLQLRQYELYIVLRNGDVCGAIGAEVRKMWIIVYTVDILKSVLAERQALIRTQCKQI
jgi:hypothetical protein